MVYFIEYFNREYIFCNYHNYHKQQLLSFYIHFIQPMVHLIHASLELWRFCVLWGLLQASPTFTKGLINSPIPVRNKSLLALPFNKPMPHFMINIFFLFYSSFAILNNTASYISRKVDFHEYLPDIQRYYPISGDQ